MRTLPGEKWLNFLSTLLLLPTVMFSEKLSLRSTYYLSAFQAMFPEIDVHSTKLFDFVKEQAVVKRVMLLNGLACKERQLNYRQKRAATVKSVYQMMALPIDIMYSTTFPPPKYTTDTDSLYGYIPVSDYNKFNLTESELAISKEGWDYSPYYAPGETTTEFIFPSWNYGGHCPVAFWKDWTNHELDLVQSTYIIPDNLNGYTNEKKIRTFEEFYDTFWDTVYSIPHRCDNYTSIFACLEGPENTNPNWLDSPDDPVDKK